MKAKTRKGGPEKPPAGTQNGDVVDSSASAEGELLEVNEAFASAKVAIALELKEQSEFEELGPRFSGLPSDHLRETIFESVENLVPTDALRDGRMEVVSRHGRDLAQSLAKLADLFDPTEKQSHEWQVTLTPVKSTDQDRYPPPPGNSKTEIDAAIRKGDVHAIGRSLRKAVEFQSELARALDPTHELEGFSAKIGSERRRPAARHNKNNNGGCGTCQTSEVRQTRNQNTRERNSVCCRASRCQRIHGQQGLGVAKKLPRPLTRERP